MTFGRGSAVNGRYVWDVGRETCEEVRQKEKDKRSARRKKMKSLLEGKG